MSPPISPIEVKANKARSKGRAVGQALLALLDTTSLCSESAVELAISDIDRHLADPSTDLGEAITVLQRVPYLLEFTLCTASEYAFRTMSNAIVEGAPSSAEDYPTSLLSTVLTRILDRLLEDGPSELTGYKRSFNETSSVLDVIRELSANDALTERDDGPPSPRAMRRRQSIAARSARSPVDVKAILEYGAEVPRTKAQATALASRVIAEQLSLLKEYLSALRSDGVAMLYKRKYLPQVYDSPKTLRIDTQPTDRTSSALYFDNIECFGPWRISISTRASKDLRAARKEDAKRFKIICNKIKDLSHGYFTPDNYKMLLGGSVDVPIYEAKMTRDSRLVYHIHLEPDWERQVEEQVIRILGVYTHAQIDQRFWGFVSQQLSSHGGSEYRKRCLFRNKPTGADGTVLPKTFDASFEQRQEVALSPASAGMKKEDMEELHALLALEKFVTFSQEFLNSILADQDVAHVFNLSAHEQEVMAHPSSCFVIGRSGTGKTTTMLFKMLAKERSWAERFQASMGKPRQLFVTQAQLLVQKVKEYYEDLTHSFETAALSPKELKRLASESSGRSKRHTALLLNADEELQWDSSLPRRYGALTDADFPLFITYNHLCRLLEGEFRHILETEQSGASKATVLRDILQLRPGKTIARRHRMSLEDARGNFIDYDKFRDKYWSQYADTVADMTPELVFGEFMGVIKGSEKALKSEKGYLDREAYRNGRRRSQATSPEQRDIIYNLFEAYCCNKRANGHYDAADRTRILIKCLESYGVPGRALTFIYVDEVQDNLLIDALVLRKLCSNPHGMFWAGDTAQTISAGSAFRFTELRAFMYDVNEDDALAKREQAQIFQLATNYRSHAGIVDCAYSVTEILTKYWPDSIDKLPAEKGITAGAKPIFFSNEDGAQLRAALFTDNANGGGMIEFGAKQCILVRNDAARKRLEEEIGDVGQVLTIYESKGLEFDDVLLYNFFQDSMVEESRWAVILNEVSGCFAPQFDEGKHTGVSRELKHLYVAITRARMNLWIADSSPKAGPILRYWQFKGLIQIHRPGDPLPTGGLAKKSGKDEWAEAARSLFGKGQYAEAVRGFARAGLEHERQVALAYLLRSQALSTAVNARSEPSKASKALAFTQAAQAFMAAAPDATVEKERLAYYRIAGECFARAGDDRKAGAVYRLAEQYTLAAQHFRKAGSFDDAVEIVTAHDVDHEVAESIRDVSKLHYVRENKVEKALKLKLFEDDDNALEYMDDYGLDDSRAIFLEKRGRYAEAAECCLADGDRNEAIRLFVRDRATRQSTIRAVDCILDVLWTCLSLGTPEENWNDPIIPELLGQVELLDCSVLGADALYELKMFQAVYADDVSKLCELGDVLFDQGNLAGTVLCLDQVFSHTLDDMEAYGLSDIAERFRSFLKLARSLQRLSCDPDPCSNNAIQKLFAFKISNEEMYSVSHRSHLFALCEGGKVVGTQPTGDGGLLVPRWELERSIRSKLSGRLKGHVEYQNEMCHNLRSLQPCLLFAVHHICPKRECKSLHVDAEDVVPTYNILVRIHVLQIMIFHTLFATDVPFSKLAHQQRAWLRRLYEAIFPPHPRLGSLHILSPTSIPELQQPEGRRIITTWVRDFLNRINPIEDTPRIAFLVNLMRATRLAILFDRHNAGGNLHRIPCALRFEKPRALIRHGERYIVDDLIAVMCCNYPGALDRGVRFMNHVLQARVDIDISVLCDFMDRLCGTILVASYLKWSGSLHGLVLPRSWLAWIVGDLGRLNNMRVEQATRYLAHLSQLLQRIYTGLKAGHLLVGNSGLSPRTSKLTRISFMQRILNNLCIWGQNRQLHMPTIRSEIMRLVHLAGSTPPVDEDMHAMARRYFDCTRWEDLARMTIGTVYAHDVDGLVQLCHLPRQVLAPSSLPVQPIRYWKHEEIGLALGVGHVGLLSSDSDRGCHMDTDEGAQWTVVPALQHQPGVTSATDTTNEDEDEEPSTRPEFTCAEERAASRIITVYRKYLERKAAEKDAMTEMRIRFFAEYEAHATGVEWLNRGYRHLFCRIVPRLVLSLECLKDYLHQAKAVLKAAIRAAAHEDLEDVQATMDEVSRSFKEVHRLHKALLPTASIHRMCDLKTLAAHARAIHFLHSQVEAKRGQGFLWRVDVQLAMSMLSGSAMFYS